MNDQTQSTSQTITEFWKRKKKKQWSKAKYSESHEKTTQYKPVWSRTETEISNEWLKSVYVWCNKWE